MSSYFHRKWQHQADTEASNNYTTNSEELMENIKHVPRQTASFEEDFSDDSLDEPIQYTPESTVALPECPIASTVMKKLKTRADEGMVTYGTTLADNPLSSTEWIDHAVEELLDAANYLTRLKLQLQTDRS